MKMWQNTEESIPKHVPQIVPIALYRKAFVP